MSLYLHMYENARGQYDSEVGIAETCDEAMRWLDDWHDSYVRGGAKYLHTLIVMDHLSETTVTYRRNLLKDLDDWRVEQDRQERLERRHEQGLRVAR